MGVQRDAEAPRRHPGQRRNVAGDRAALAGPWAEGAGDVVEHRLQLQRGLFQFIIFKHQICFQRLSINRN